jgi:hypothetical protein
MPLLRDVLPVARQPTHAERTANTLPLSTSKREANKRSSTFCTEPCQARLSGRAACRQDAALPTKTLPVGAVGLSTETRRTSKKLNLCGPLPVARTLDVEAKT